MSHTYQRLINGDASIGTLSAIMKIQANWGI